MSSINASIVCCVVFSVPSLVLTILLALLSLCMTLGQPLFQISIATGYDDELDPCKDTYVPSICV